MLDDDDTKKNSSPRAPYIDLHQSINLIDTLCKEGLNPSRFSADEFFALSGKRTGTTIRKLATLGYFGVIFRLSKASYCLSQDTVLLLNPETSDDRKQSILHQMLLRPEVFGSLFGRFGMRSDLYTLAKYLREDNFPAFHKSGARMVARNYMNSCNFVLASGSEGLSVTPPPVPAAGAEKNWQVITGGVYDVTDPSSEFEVRICGTLTPDRIDRIISRLQEIKSGQS